MFRTRSRRRRLLLGAAVATCSLAGLYGGSASAALNLNTSTDTNISIDPDTHSFQGSVRPITVGDYQYFGYWDAVDPVDDEVYLMVTRRNLRDDRLQTIRFDGTGGTEALPIISTGRWDGHNYVGLGISNDGRIHLSWSLHTFDRQHRYVRSASGCTGQTEGNFTAANCRFDSLAYEQVRDQAGEGSMTYPIYFNDNNGNLYFTWRNGGSSHGDQYINSYNNDGTWTARGIAIRGHADGMARDTNNYPIDPDGDGRDFLTGRERGVYAQEWEFDSRNRLHVIWLYREHLIGLAGQHGLNYAYSDDYGRTWNYENNGRTGRIATIDSDPITIVDIAQTQVVVFAPDGRSTSYFDSGWGLSSSGFELDSNGNPHAILTKAETRGAERYSWHNLQTHVWRTNDKTWRWQHIEARTDVRKGMLAFPAGIFLDKADNAYAIWARNTVDWIPANADPYEQAELPYENVVWLPESGTDGFLDIELYSATTCLDNADNIDTAIDTTRGNNQVRINLGNSTDATDVSIWWQTKESPGWNVVRSEDFVRGIRARTSAVTPYTFTIRNSEWRGTLAELEICFVGDPDNRGNMSLDSVEILNSSTRAVARLWDFTAPIEMYASEASQADNWASWRTEELFPGDGVYLTAQDGYWYVDTDVYKRDGRIGFNIHQQGSPGTEILSLREFRLTSDSIIKDWRFDADAQGWIGYHHVRDFAWANDGGTKGIGATLTGNDSALLSLEAMDLPINRNGRYVHMRMKHDTAATSARLWFRTATDRTWTAGKSKTITNLRRSSNYETYTFDMDRVTGWEGGLIYQIELDPIEDAGITRGTFKVDRIWIDNTP